MTTWDIRVFGRALSLAVLAFAVGWLVTAATDEGGVAWGVRAGRTLPLAPVCAAVGAWIALAPSRARGEMVALAALGRAPWQSALAASLGGAAMALLAAAAMASAPAVDVRGFFPVAGHKTDYVYEGGTFVAPSRGVRIERDGSFAELAATTASVTPAPSPVPSHGRAAAALATALAGLALPMLTAIAFLTRASAARAAASVFATAVLSVVLFHAAAALRVPALLATVPAALLLALAAAMFFAREDRRMRA